MILLILPIFNLKRGIESENMKISHVHRLYLKILYWLSYLNISAMLFQSEIAYCTKDLKLKLMTPTKKTQLSIKV